MNNQENKHRDNTPLKALLDKKNQPEGSPEDDFGKEALEGFAMLEGDEESLRLKEQLDERIYARVFTQDTQKSSKGYYWYAAAGLLFLVGLSVYLFRNDTLTRQETLAVHTENHTKAPEQEQTLRSAPAAPAEPGPVTPEIQAPLPKNRPPVKAVEEQAPALSGGTILRDAAEPHPEKQREQAVFAEDQVEAEAPGALSEKEAASSKQYAAPAMKKTARADLDLAMNTSQSGAPPEVESMENARSSSDSFSGGSAVSCSYKGGEKAFQKDLRTLLSARNLLYGFEATLYIGAKGKVEKVIFTSQENPGKTEQKAIREVLSEMDKFQVHEPGKQGEYKVIFRP